MRSANLSSLCRFSAILSLVLGSASHISANDEVIHDIKSMKWKKIESSISQKRKISIPEAYALVRFHEEVSQGKQEYRFRLLFSIVSKNYVEKIEKKDVSSLLSSGLSLSTPILKVSFWKLYKELVKRNLLDQDEKISYLQILSPEADPTYFLAMEEILRIHSERGDYSSILKFINNPTTLARTLATDRVRYYEILALLRTGDSEKALKIFTDTVHSEMSSDIKKDIFSELKRQLGTEFYLKLDPNFFYGILSLLNKEEQKLVIQKNLVHPELQVEDVQSLKNISNFLFKISPKYCLKFIHSNRELASTDALYIATLAENLINTGEFGLAYSLQNEIINKSESALIFKNYTRIYTALKDEERAFSSKIKYLSLNPYDLHYQDMLIDFLAETGTNSISYAPQRYWEKAMSEIPNVSVKGRLVYWYLRYLRFSNDFDKLKSILSDFYFYCPGSYYATVISEEFRNELSELTHPANYLSNRDSLLKFISVKHNIDFVGLLGGQNLSFAFSKTAVELSNRLHQAEDRVRNTKVLTNAAEYIKIGNYSEGITLAEHFFKSNKITDREKYELLVGLGDVGKNNYLSLYYTRLLMKEYQIPDDPLLIPSELTNRLYPRPHRQIVRKYSTRYDIEEEIVYAIMRQESFFRENAVSPANARGLMQVMPSTGRFLASRLNVVNYSLHDPEVSIQFGAKFLADLLKQNGNKLTWASIAYNGGPGNLRKWKRNHFKGDFNHFLEELPNKESRDYCRVILSNYMIYKTLKKLENRN